MICKTGFDIIGMGSGRESGRGRGKGWGKEGEVIKRERERDDLAGGCGEGGQAWQLKKRT